MIAGMNIEIHVTVDKPEQIGDMLQEIEKQIEAHSGNCTLRLDVYDIEKYGLKLD